MSTYINYSNLTKFKFHLQSFRRLHIGYHHFLSLAQLQNSSNHDVLQKWKECISQLCASYTILPSVDYINQPKDVDLTEQMRLRTPSWSHENTFCSHNSTYCTTEVQIRYSGQQWQRNKTRVKSQLTDRFQSMSNSSIHSIND